MIAVSDAYPTHFEWNLLHTTPLTITRHYFARGQRGGAYNTRALGVATS